jgi:hypothetical protein
VTSSTETFQPLGLWGYPGNIITTAAIRQTVSKEVGLAVLKPDEEFPRVEPYVKPTAAGSSARFRWTEKRVSPATTERPQF